MLQQERPTWRELVIHESSPGVRGASRLLKSAVGYTSSQLLKDVPLGATMDGVRNEDLAHLTISSGSLDVLVTQDVLEHVLQPRLVYQEMARVLKPGGIHVATFPWYPERAITRIRASRGPLGQIIHHEQPAYHRSPVGDGSALVTMDWGADVYDWAQDAGLSLQVFKLQQDRSVGIDGEYREVFVFRRPA